MSAGYDHRVLIVDDQREIGKVINRLLNKKGVRSFYASSGSEALTAVQKAARPFSLILSDYKMPGMAGIPFLEQAKTIAPDTVRFLMTGYADINAVISAVNLGAVHRFIIKPWDNDELMDMIQAGLDYFELTIENHKLFKLAKKQNAKLYALSQELRQNTDAHKNILVQKEQEIAQLKKRLETGGGSPGPEDFTGIETLFHKHLSFNGEDINRCYGAVVSTLFSEFKDLAARNGFFMPEDQADARAE